MQRPRLVALSEPSASISRAESITRSGEAGFARRRGRPFDGPRVHVTQGQQIQLAAIGARVHELTFDANGFDTTHGEPRATIGDVKGKQAAVGGSNPAFVV